MNDLKTFFEHAAVGMAKVALDGSFISVNQRLAEITGYPQARLRSLRFQDISHPDDLPADLHHVASLLNGNLSSYSLEKRYIRPDGTTVWANLMVTLIRKPNGEPSHFISLIEDINARKLQQQQAEATSERFRNLFDAVDAIAVQGYDKTRKVIYWNKASERLYGFSAEEAQGKQLEDLIIPPFMREAVIMHVQRWIEQGIPIPAGELNLLRKDGTLVPVFSSHVLQYNGNGEPEMFCLDVDLTDLKDMHSALLVAKEAAEAASNAKSAFLATMSHEIRTPLNGVLGMLQLALTTPLNDEQRDFIQTAMVSARNLLRVLSDILDICKVEAGRMDILQDTFSLQEVLQPIMESFTHEAVSKGLELRHSVQMHTDAMLQGDAGRLRQILYNLVGNAIKYTPSGGVDLSIFSLPHPTQPDAILLHMDVADTGIGILPQHLTRVFGIFTQVDSTYARRFGGTGLGLSIVQKLLQLLGGTVTLCSMVDVGTDVHVVIPLTTATQATHKSTPPPRQPAAQFRKARILVVEDDPVNQLTVMHFLGKIGHSSTLAHNGQHALELLAENDFDCILMDIQMPVMDGVTATRALRDPLRFGVRSTTPVIALTSYAMTTDREAFMEAGMNAYIAKPMEMETLRLVIDRVLDAGAGFVALREEGRERE